MGGKKGGRERAVDMQAAREESSQVDDAKRRVGRREGDGSAEMLDIGRRVFN